MSAALKSLPPTHRVSAAEFLSWPEDRSIERLELVDGTPTAMAPPSHTHARLQARLTVLLDAALRQSNSPCQVSVTPGVRPGTQGDWNVRIPDLTVDCDTPAPGEPLVRNPTVVIEVLSPGNEHRTRANMWAYMTLPSVQEILFLYAWRIGGELLRRDRDGSWPDRATPLSAGDRIVLQGAGLDVCLDDAYATTGLLG